MYELEMDIQYAYVVSTYERIMDILASIMVCIL